MCALSLDRRLTEGHPPDAAVWPLLARHPAGRRGCPSLTAVDGWFTYTGLSWRGWRGCVRIGAASFAGGCNVVRTWKALPEHYQGPGQEALWSAMATRGPVNPRAT
ncbi:hypothetical protein GCM10027059_14490 [Myceligenerans halotolerans]